MDTKKRKVEENDASAISSKDLMKLLEPFTREQLKETLHQAATRHPDVLDEIRKLADKEPAHRKLFVRGLGWGTTSDDLESVFSPFGELEGANVIMDKSTGKSKGYGFVIFKHLDAALRALKEPSKLIEGRMSFSQLASTGAAQPQASQTARKIYVGNVPLDISPDKLLNLFSQYGEIEEGPLGLDKLSGSSKGFALFIYKSVESVKRALEEPVKTIDGNQVICKLGGEGQKQKMGSQGLLEGVDLSLVQAGGAASTRPFGAVNPTTLAGGISLNQLSGLSTNQSLASLNASLNPFVAQQLALNSSLGSSLGASLNPSLNSSFNASLTQGTSQSFAQALGQTPTSMGISTYGVHGLGAYAPQIQQSIGVPQSSHAGMLGTNLYYVPTSSITSQTALFQAVGAHNPSAPFQNSHVTQASGTRVHYRSSYTK